MLMGQRRGWTRALAPAVVKVALAGLAAASAGTACPLPQESAQEDPLDRAAARAMREAPRRARIGKIRGARFRSTIDFDDPTAEPHQLRLSVAFPGRSRLTLSRDRWSVERFQLGEVWFGLDRSNSKLDSEARSALLTGRTLETARFDVAMRRTLFLWPDAGDLTGDGFTRTAKVADVGVLIATLDRDSGRPIDLKAFGRDGSVQAEFRSIRWSAAEGRWWPASFELHVDGRRVWRETVEDIETGWNFTDLWFLPVDRSRGLAGQPNEERLRMVPSQPAWIRSFPLSNGADLEACRQEGRAAVEEAQRELGPLGLDVSPRFVVLLDAGRRPSGLEVRVVRPQPGDGDLRSRPGWRAAEGALGWTFVAGEAMPDAGAFEAVAGACRSSGDPVGHPGLLMEADPGAPITVFQPFTVPEDKLPPGGRTP
jgi:hypothetical protein